IGAIKQGESSVGNRTRVKVVKNKLAPPFREVEFDIMYGTGLSKEGDLLDLASENNIIEKSGAWFAFGGERIGQGRENAKEFLHSRLDVAAAIERKVLEHFGIVRAGDASSTSGAPPAAAEKSAPPPANGAAKKAQPRSEA